MLPERIGVFLALAAAICCRWRRRAVRAALLLRRAASWSSACPTAPPPVAGAKIRTPDGLDVAAAEKLAQSLGLQFSLRQLTAEEAGPALASGQVDLVLASAGVEAAAAVPGAQLAWQGTGYAVRPKAVIRSDTRMRSAPTRAAAACMAQAATAAQAQARAWGRGAHLSRAFRCAGGGARGRLRRGPIDDALWEPLMRFPEWKFSSTLAAEGARAERAWLVSAAAPADRAWLAAEMRAWDRAGAWKALAAKWARDVAFDVYLDQEVPAGLRLGRGRTAYNARL